MDYQKNLEELNKYALAYDEFEKMSSIVRYMLTNSMIKGASLSEKEALIVSEFEAQMKLQWQNMKRAELKPKQEDVKIRVIAYKFMPNRPEIYLAIEYPSLDYQVFDQKMADFYSTGFEKPDWDSIYNEGVSGTRKLQASDA